MKKWLWLIFFLFLALDIFLVSAYYQPSLTSKLLRANVLEFARDYRITGQACAWQEAANCTDISFAFQPSEKSLSATPSYKIIENPQNAATEIIFENTRPADGFNFSYEEIAGNPSIEDIGAQQIGNALVLTVKRKGVLTPAQTTVQDNLISIRFPAADQTYPQFRQAQPANETIAYSTWQTISIQASTGAPLKTGLIFLQDEPVDFTTKNLGFNQYSFELARRLEFDQEYKIRAIVIDQAGRAAAFVWQFGIQKSLARTVLGQDRFKYLGWWGQINSTSTPVMAEASTRAAQLDTFSTINRVKILAEVDGEEISGNSLWLQIDGGARPGAFIHSSFVTPIAQPQPPKNFEIPAGVQENEYWIDTDLTAKVLTLFQYNEPVFATYIATGRPGNPTLEGTWRVWYKLVKTRMRGGPPVVPFFYDLPNVPYVMYYYNGYGIHGTYWHDKFGTRQSSGCTNLTQGDAKFVFEKTLPALPEDKNALLSGADNLGAVIHNHY